MAGISAIAGIEYAGTNVSFKIVPLNMFEPLLIKNNEFQRWKRLQKIFKTHVLGGMDAKGNSVSKNVYVWI